MLKKKIEQAYQETHFLYNYSFWDYINDKDRAKEFLETIFPDKDIAIISIEIGKKMGKVDYKKIELDVLINTQETLINIEIQNKNQDDIISRSLFYGSSIITEALKSKDSYRELKDVVVVFINNFNIIGNDLLINSYHLANDVTNKRLTNKLSLIYINRTIKQDKNDIIELLEILACNSDYHIDKYPYTVGYIKKMKCSKKGRKKMEDYLYNIFKDDIEQAANKAEKKGIEKGIEEGMLKLLEKLVEDEALTITQASSYYGTSEKKFIKLLNKAK